MAQINSPIKEQAVQGVAVEIQSALVEMIDLSLLGKQAHWNLFGPHFLSLHQQLDTLVDSFRSISDELAERCVTIGVSPDGLAKTVASHSKLAPFPPGRIPDDQVVELMCDRLGTVIQRQRERLEKLEHADPVTHDLFIKSLETLEKHHWMLRSQKA
ncbi:MAG TPA: DNA starvation/stationary phase protection protein [Pantanalinema sp.]